MVAKKLSGYKDIKIIFPNEWNNNEQMRCDEGNGVGIYEILKREREVTTYYISGNTVVWNPK